MRRAAPHLLALAPTLALVLAMGCGDTLPSATVVDSLRLFALVTPTPEIHPGSAGVVTVDAVWVDAHPGVPARPVWFEWRLCPDLPDPRGCPLSPAGAVLASVAGAGADHLAIDAARLPLPEGAPPRGYVVYLAMCPGHPPVVEAALGHYRCAAPDGLEAYRRIVVRPPGDALNHDPGIAAVRGLPVDPTAPPPACCAATLPAGGPATTPLGVEPALDAAEVAPELAGGLETLLLSAYADLGSFNAPHIVEMHPGDTDALTLQWTHAHATGTARVWLVLRDERGGETAWAATVNFVP